MGSAARRLDPLPSASERRAMLLALPLSDEPATEEEMAIFAQAEADVRAGRRGVTTEEMLAVVDRLPRDEDD